MSDYQDPTLADAGVPSLSNTDRTALEAGSGIKTEVN